MLEPSHRHEFSINSDRKNEIKDKINNIINMSIPKPKMHQILTTLESASNPSATGSPCLAKGSDCLSKMKETILFSQAAIFNGCVWLCDQIICELNAVASSLMILFWMK